MEEINGEDPGGLRVQELPPGRAIPARCGIDTRSMQDLIDVDGATVTPSLASSPCIRR